MMAARKHCDFLLVAALHKEFHPAVRSVFKAKRIPKSRHETHNYYDVNITTVHKRQYSIRLVCVGKQGSARTVATVRDAVKARRPHCIIMFGIAAVVPGRGRKKGHILVSEEIVDIPEAKVQPKVALPRPQAPFPCDVELINHLRDEFPDEIGKTLHVGSIISQPNLSKSAHYRTRLVEHVENFTNRKGSVIGLEMEGGGLATAISELPRGWGTQAVLIKGGVDWGSYHKTDQLQRRTALRVAQFVERLLKSEPVAATRTGKPRIARAKRLLPMCHLAPVVGMGMNAVMQREENKHKVGARFGLRLTMHLIVGARPLEWLALRVTYYAHGCPCLTLIPSLRVGREIVKLVEDHAHFANPLFLDADRTYIIDYGHEMFSPPVLVPIDCDNGDLMILAQVRVRGETRSTEITQAFRLESGGTPRPISRVREPPRLSDREVEQWHKVGQLSAQQMEELKGIPGTTRYMAAIAQDDFGGGQGISAKTVDLLRDLFKKGPPRGT
jgi:nucleoside phosphorylase